MEFGAGVGNNSRITWRSRCEVSLVFLEESWEKTSYDIDPQAGDEFLEWNKHSRRHVSLFILSIPSHPNRRMCSLPSHAIRDQLSPGPGTDKPQACLHDPFPHLKLLVVPWRIDQHVAPRQRSKPT